MFDCQYHNCPGLNAWGLWITFWNYRNTVVFSECDVQEFRKKPSCATRYTSLKAKPKQKYSPLMNTPLPCSGLTLPWSQLRYQYPDRDVSVITKISLKSYQDLRYFLCVNLLQFWQILAQIWVSHRSNNKRSFYSKLQTHETLCERWEIAV